ncbi:MAG: ABC transporter permease subunit [Spirochaetes bacterium]|jgi:sodium transport system permease protein|nr:ABC transporter permease subunit [Spirochaetota bacterium]
MIQSIITIFKKESLDALRDFRSLVITFLFPLIVFPAAVLLMGNKDANSYTISVRDLEPALITHLDRDPLITVVKEPTDDSLTEKALKAYSLDAAVVMYNKEYFNAVEIVYNNSTQKSIEALEYIKVKLTEYQMNYIIENPELPHPGFVVTFFPVHDVYQGASMFILFSLLPVLIVIISITSPIAIAADIFAGEKERNSLELLLSNPVSRFSIVIGKFSAVFIFGFVGVICFLAGFLLSVAIDSSFLGLSNLIITGTQIRSTLLLIAMLSLITSSIEICISIFAKSTKEAQLYILPLTMLFSAVNYISEKYFFIQDSFLSGEIVNYIPVLNIITAIRSVMMNREVTSSVPLVTVNLLLVIFILCISQYALSHEKIIYRS